MVLMWQLPGTKTFDSKKPVDYISELIGHEGPHSLLSQLIEMSLVSSVSSG